MQWGWFPNNFLSNEGLGALALSVRSAFLRGACFAVHQLRAMLIITLIRAAITP